MSKVGVNDNQTPEGLSMYNSRGSSPMSLAICSMSSLTLTHGPLIALAPQGSRSLSGVAGVLQVQPEWHSTLVFSDHL